MKLFVPACGDRIILTENWEFILYLEHRNIAFAVSQGLKLKGHEWKYKSYNTGKERVRYQSLYNEAKKDPYTHYLRAGLKSQDITLAKGTTLECDRVYIRGTNKTAKETEDSYDSITWKVVINDKASGKQRFWAKLTDCNTIECDIVSTYRDRKGIQ